MRRGRNLDKTANCVTLNAGQSTTLTVTMYAAKGAVGLTHQGALTVSTGGTEVAHAAVFTLIK